MLHSHSLKLSLCGVTCLFIVGCTNTSTSQRLLEQQKNQFEQQNSSKQAFKVAWQHEPYVKLNPTDLLQITKKQQAQFLAFYNDPKNRGASPFERVKRFTDQFITDFIPSNNNNTASEAFFSKTGNCMSLAALTAAIATTAGLDFEFQMLIQNPAYYRNGEHLIIQNHIRTKVKPTSGSADWHGIVDFFTINKKQQVATISKLEFASLYYRNLAAVKLLDGDYSVAYQLSANAMENAPYSAENINVHAIILAKKYGDKFALNLYELGLRFTKPTSNYLQNYIQLLKRNNDASYAQLLTLKLLNQQKKEPYYWLQEGNRLMAKNKLHRSLEKFEKAEALAPYLDEVFLSKAKAYYRLGLFREAKASLKKAKNSAIRVHSNKFYENKMAFFGIRK